MSFCGFLPRTHTSIVFGLQFHFLIRFCLGVRILNLLGFCFSIDPFIREDAAKSESDLTDGSDKAVTEYEVDELSDSEDIESHDTSSGTDVSMNE